MVGIEPGAAGSGSKYANHCALPPPCFSKTFSLNGFTLTRCAKIKKILDERARENGDEVDAGTVEHDHNHEHFEHEHQQLFEEDTHTDQNGMTQLLSMQVEAYMDNE